MKPKFPMPKRIMKCIFLAIVSLLLTFGMIFLAAYLTEGREVSDFTALDKRIVAAAMGADAVLMLMYIVCVFAAARMFIIRSCLIQKRKRLFGTDGAVAIYHLDGDIWYDECSAGRAVRQRHGKLLLVLIERYNHAVQEWMPTAMHFYDSPEEMQQELREKYGIEWTDRPKETAAGCVNSGEEAMQRISVSIEDGDI